MGEQQGGVGRWSHQTKYSTASSNCSELSNKWVAWSGLFVDHFDACVFSGSLCHLPPHPHTSPPTLPSWNCKQTFTFGCKSGFRYHLSKPLTCSGVMHRAMYMILYWAGVNSTHYMPSLLNFISLKLLAIVCKLVIILLISFRILRVEAGAVSSLNKWYCNWYFKAMAIIKSLHRSGMRSNNVIVISSAACILHLINFPMHYKVFWIHNTHVHDCLCKNHPNLNHKWKSFFLAYVLNSYHCTAYPVSWLRWYACWGKVLLP